VWVKPYDADEVCRTLTFVVAHVWKSFLTQRLASKTAASGTVDDAWPGPPAFTAGLGTGMTIMAVNWRKFSANVFSRAPGGEDLLKAIAAPRAK